MLVVDAGSTATIIDQLISMPVLSGEWEVRVYFLLEPPQVEVVLELKRVPGRIRRALLGLAKEHRAELLQEWSQKVHQGGDE